LKIRSIEVFLDVPQIDFKILFKKIVEKWTKMIYDVFKLVEKWTNKKKKKNKKNYMEEYHENRNYCR